MRGSLSRIKDDVSLCLILGMKINILASHTDLFHGEIVVGSLIWFGNQRGGDNSITRDKSLSPKWMRLEVFN